MASIQDLREERATVGRQLHDLLDKNPGAKWGPEQQSAYDAGLAQLDRVDQEMQRITALHERMAAEALAAAQADVAISRASKDDRPMARKLFDKWLRRGDNGLNAEEWQAIRATMSTTTNTEGGYTVPTEVANSVLDALKQYGGMRAVADVFRTDGGNPINYPTSDGTSEVGEIIAENTTATGADPTFNVITLSVYKYSSKIIAVPFELLQDTAVDMEAFIRQRIVDRLGRITNQHFTTGTGTAQPRGIITAATTGKTGTTGQTTTVIFDDLVDLVHSVDPAYRASPRVRFMMHDSSLKVVRKLKDSQNRPIFLPGFDGLGGTMGDSILGYPVQINQDMATMAANAKSIAFGDFGYYKIRDAMQMQIFRFTDSAYTKLGQVGFLAWLRSGGNFVDVGGAVKLYVNSAT